MELSGVSVRVFSDRQLLGCASLVCARGVGMLQETVRDDEKDVP